MKIAHLSVGDPFTARWAHSQTRRRDSVHVIMLKPPAELLQGIHQHLLPFRPPLGYYSNVFHLRQLIKKIKPDVLHVHYATGHGTLGRFSDFHPCVLSVWGSDVLSAPYESALMKRRVVKNLQHYDHVCCTSSVLTQGIQDLCPDIVPHQIPIGVDTETFSPNKEERKEGSWITVGTVKSLQPVYGIDILLRAFAQAKRELLSSAPEVGTRLRLQIIGDGFQRKELVLLAQKLGLDGEVEFKGYVPNHLIPEILGHMDIFVALSRSESFGVAVVEASACGVPVIVTDVGGLPEVVQHGITGFIVEKENPSTAAEAIVCLAKDTALRKQMGHNGRCYVQKNYEWEYCLDLMYKVYEKALASMS